MQLGDLDGVGERDSGWMVSNPDGVDRHDAAGDVDRSCAAGISLLVASTRTCPIVVGPHSAATGCKDAGHSPTP